MHKLLVASVACLLAAVSLHAAIDPAHFVPDDVDFVARLDWAGMREAPMIKTYLAGHPDRYQAIAGRLQTDMGIDLDKISTVWFFGQDKQNNMMAITGAFQVDTVRARLAKQNVILVKEIPGMLLAFSLGQEGDQPGRLCVFPDANTFIVGQDAMVNRFLDGLTGKAPPRVIGEAKLARLADPAHALNATILTMRPEWRQAMPLVLNLIGDAFFSATITDQVGLQLNLAPTRPEYLEPLNQLLQGLLAAQRAQMAQSQATSADPRTALMHVVFQSLSVQRDGSEVAIRLPLDLAKFFASYLDGAMAPTQAPGTQVPPETAPGTALPVPNTEAPSAASPAN